METKHTPGPWNLDKRQEKLMGANGQSIVVWNSGLSFGNRTEEAEANARLIASAPELLAACSRAFNLIKESGFSSGLIEEEFDGTLNQLDAAIAKVEGR